jgi:hypothetical protein
VTAVDSDVSTWNNAAAQHVRYIFNLNVKVDASTERSERVRTYLDGMIDEYFDSTDKLPTPFDWVHLAQLAVLASGHLDEEETIKILCSKQLDYGPNNIARFGHVGLLLRLHDKVARLENLILSGRDAQNESLHDTYLDIVGYSTIGLMLLDGSFFFPMASFA